jgi:histone H1/5
MVSEAVKALKDRTGSSLQAIKKYIGAHYKGLPTGWEKTLSVQVKKLSHDGKLQKVKASYKLGEALKKAPKKAKVRWARAGRPAPCALSCTAHSCVQTRHLPLPAPRRWPRSPLPRSRPPRSPRSLARPR